MDFTMSEELSMLKDSVQHYLSAHYTLEQRKQTAQSEPGYRSEIWQSLHNELGLLTMTLPEELGGLNMDAVATQVVMESMGEALVLEPYLETVVFSGDILLRAGGDKAQALLAQLAEGNLKATVAWAEPESRHSPLRVSTEAKQSAGGWVLNGYKSVVHAAPWADGFIVSARVAGNRDDEAGLALFWIDASTPGVELAAYPTIDGRRAADIRLNQVEVAADCLLGTVGQGADLLQQAMLRATAAVCAEGVGVCRRLLADTVDYSKQRQQFGQPIGKFQVLQHRMVDMHMAVEMAASATLLASISLAENHPDSALNVSMAKARVNQSCQFVGQNAVQLHGGMGLTDELAIGHYFKRATVIASLFGSTDYHTRKVAELTR